jgi:histidinol-phosphate/aromatic aminotransferase/cobyric acid decarboxylase-like protein/adenosyl cobinamide kinase/adenosyl cobinamide phosphate guanylyltransferase
VTLTLVIGGTRSGKSAHAEALAASTGLPVRYVATADAGDPSMRERIDAHRARRPASWTTVETAAGLRPAAVAGAGVTGVGVTGAGVAGAGVAGAGVTRAGVTGAGVTGAGVTGAGVTGAGVDGWLAEACADARTECILVDGLGPWIARLLHRSGAFDDPVRLPVARADVRAAVTLALGPLALAGAAIVVAEQVGDGLLPTAATSRAWIDLMGETTQRLSAAAARVDLVVAGRAITIGGRTLDPASALLDPGSALLDPASALLDADDDRALRRHGDRDVRPGDADHAVNVVWGGPPDWLRTALDAALSDAAGSYPREDDTLAAIGARHGREPSEIVPTNGAAEALWLLGPALRPRLAACIHPGFTEAEAALRAHRVPTVRVLRDPARDFALDPAAVPDAADLVIVGNPASPSGTLDPAAAILALRRPGRIVVVDEAFMDLVPGEVGSLVRECLDDTIVIRSLTKALGIPGLRAGYAVAGAHGGAGLAGRLRAVRPPWSANVLALAALRAACEHPDEIAGIAARSSAEREDLAERLDGLAGVRVWPGAANFVLVEVDDGPAAVAALRAAGIAVRPAASFPGLDDRHIRVTARDPARNARVAVCLAASLAAGQPLRMLR